MRRPVLRTLLLACAGAALATGCRTLFETTIPERFGTPQQVRTRLELGRARVFWSAVEDATGYSVYLSSSSLWSEPGFGSDDLIAVSGMLQTTATEASFSLPAGTWWIAVTARDEVQETAPTRPLALQIDPSRALRPPLWTFVYTTGEVGSHMGHTASIAGDVDDDGFEDLVVAGPGAFGYVPGGGLPDGRFLLFEGRGGTFADPSWTASLPGGGGFHAVRAGDVDGDGFDDIVLAAPNYDTTATGGPGEGAAYLFRGSADPATPGAALYELAAITARANEYLSSGIAAVGDVNADEKPDVAFGAPVFFSADPGRVVIFPGELTGGPVYSAYQGTNANAELGRSLVRIGDELVVGEPAASSGRVHFFALPDLDAHSVVGAPPDRTRFGHTVAAADVNGDGEDDLLVLSLPDPPLESAFLDVLLTPSLLRSSVAFDAQIAPDRPDALTVSRAGDVNADGFEDVLVGEPGANGEVGRVSLFLGGPGGIAPRPAWTESGGADDERHGQGLAPVGDLDGDGFDDFLVGTPGYFQQRGRVQIRRGGRDVSPLVDAGFPRRVHVGQDVGLVGSLAADPRGMPFTCELDCDLPGSAPALLLGCGEPPFQHSADVTEPCRYDAPGSYRVRLRVTTTDGRTADATTTIEVLR